LRTVNLHYLPWIPRIEQDGQKVDAFTQIFTDFGIVDVHPHDLSAAQRIPHKDPVPVFGLIYLNQEERGGTLFFEQIAAVTSESAASGYITESTPEFRLCGRIEAQFNRLAIYPGFVPHSGEIAGSWITDERRIIAPRLTQRLLFSL
jgi:hypothetical protein